MALLIENHKVAIEVAVSKTAIPIHFAMIGATDLEVPSESSETLVYGIFLMFLIWVRPMMTL